MCTCRTRGRGAHSWHGAHVAPAPAPLEAGADAVHAGPCQSRMRQRSRSLIIGAVCGTQTHQALSEGPHTSSVAAHHILSPTFLYMHFYRSPTRCSARPPHSGLLPCRQLSARLPHTASPLLLPAPCHGRPTANRQPPPQLPTTNRPPGGCQVPRGGGPGARGAAAAATGGAAGQRPRAKGARGRGRAGAGTAGPSGAGAAGRRGRLLRVRVSTGARVRWGLRVG